jgi:hypothetical protein
MKILSVVRDLLHADRRNERQSEANRIILQILVVNRAYQKKKLNNNWRKEDRSSGLVPLLSWQQAGWFEGYLRISCPGGWRRIAGNHSGRRTLDCCMCEPWSGVWSANPVGHTHTCSELKCNVSAHTTPTPAYNELRKKHNTLYFVLFQILYRSSEVKIYILYLTILNVFSLLCIFLSTRDKNTSHLSRP